MTPFEKWCNENGYDPKGEFELMVDTFNMGKGDLVTLAHDDSTNLPRFSKKKKGCYYIYLHHLSQHKTEPKMTEQKLPIPRMVEVRDSENDPWQIAELLADLSDFEQDDPYICRFDGDPKENLKWTYMREIPQPKTRPMTPRELLDAIRNGAVRRWADSQEVYWDWHDALSPEDILLCYDWHGNDSDVWVKAEVTE